jgi:hypothetical protein
MSRRKRDAMRSFTITLLLAVSLAGGARGQAQSPTPAGCPTGWSSNAALTAATASAEYSTARLTPGQAAMVTLHPISEVRFAVPPGRRGDASGYGGMMEIEVREAGTYQVGLSAGAWIDMLMDGNAMTSTAHGHETGCADLRKMVSFSLKPGRHVIQLSGNKETTIKILVAGP